VKLERKCELGGTDNGQGQRKFVSVHTFKATFKDCCIHYSVFFKAEGRMQVKIICMYCTHNYTFRMLISLFVTRKNVFFIFQFTKMSSNWNFKNQGTSHEHINMSITTWAEPFGCFPEFQLVYCVTWCILTYMHYTQVQILYGLQHELQQGL